MKIKWWKEKRGGGACSVSVDFDNSLKCYGKIIGRKLNDERMSEIINLKSSLIL